MPSSVDLGEALERFVDVVVKSGRYGSRSEVLREGIRLVQEREAQLARFDAEIDKGIADVKAGRTKVMDEVFDRLIAKYEARSKRAA